MSYEKESVDSLQSVEGYAVGDKVKFSEYYIANYVNGNAWKDRIGKVVKIVSRTISKKELYEGGKDAVRLFLEKYGMREKYDVVGLYVKYEDDNAVYVASPFGYDKV